MGSLWNIAVLSIGGLLSRITNFGTLGIQRTIRSIGRCVKDRVCHVDVSIRSIDARRGKRCDPRRCHDRHWSNSCRQRRAKCKCLVSLLNCKLLGYKCEILARYRIQDFATSRWFTTMSRTLHLNPAETLSIHMIGSSHSRDVRSRERWLKSRHAVLVCMGNVIPLGQFCFEVFGELGEWFFFETTEGGWGVGLWDSNFRRGFACWCVWVIVCWKAVLSRTMTEAAPASRHIALTILRLGESKVKGGR